MCVVSHDKHVYECQVSQPISKRCTSLEFLVYTIKLNPRP